MKRAILISIAVLIAVSSSAVGRKKMKKIMDSWLGGNKQQLYYQFGPPDRTTSDGGTGEIVIYAQRVYIPPTPLPFGGGYTGGADYYKYKMFLVDKDGKIYGWRLENRPNPPEQVDVNVRFR